MGLTVQVDTTKFNKMLADLSRRTGKTSKQVMKEEAASVLKICVQLSKIKSKGKLKKLNARGAHIAAKFNKRYTTPDKNLTWNDGSRRGTAGNAYLKIKGAKGNSVVNLAQRYKQNNKKGFDKTNNRVVESPFQRWKGTNYQWAIDQVQNDLSLINGLRQDFDYTKAQGLTVQGWLHIADSLGVNLLQAAPKSAKVERKIAAARSATSARGRRYRNGFAIVQPEHVTLINRFPNANRPIFGNNNKTGNDLFNIAIKRRLGAYKQAIKNDLFKNARASGFKFSTV